MRYSDEPNEFPAPDGRYGVLDRSGVTALAETGRIKRKPPTDLEAERIASEMAMSDGLLQKGDIVVTDRGFFVFRGIAADGFSYDFAPVPNPLPSSKSK